MRGRVRSRLGGLPLRARLVAGFIAAMLVLLTAAGVLVYWRVQYALDRGLDSELARASRAIAPLVDVSGRITSVDAANATGAGWQVLDARGRVLASGGPVPTTAFVASTRLTGLDQPRTIEIGRLLPRSDHPFRVRLSAVDDGGVRLYLAVGVRRDHRDEALRELLLQLGLAGGGSLLGAAVVGDLLARAALRPVERYRGRAEQIAGGSAGLRLDVPSGRDDEVTRLGHTLNDMLGALENALESERRFVNDASHELRTPLTLLTSRIQLARRRPRDNAEHEQILDELAVDVARLADLAEHLLAMGSTSSVSATSDVDDVVGSVVRRRVEAGHADQLSVRLEESSARAAIDPIVLDRVVTNLVDNAFVHGAPPVVVDVGLATGSDGARWVRIAVSDAGHGMPGDLLGEAIHRFVRAPEARSRPGSGLGLSLVEAVVTAVGGELCLCHDGIHTRHGAGRGPACPEHTAMTATVLLPESG